MHDRTLKLGPGGPARRLTALVALGALVLPSARGLLCSAGGHEASHAAGAAAAVSASHTAGPVTAAPPAHSHGAARVPTGGTVDRFQPPVAVLDRASTDDAGCHGLMSCGATLVAAEWADSPRSSRPAVAGAPERLRNLLLDRPGLGPVLPPPRA